MLKSLPPLPTPKAVENLAPWNAGTRTQLSLEYITRNHRCTKQSQNSLGLSSSFLENCQNHISKSHLSYLVLLIKYINTC